MMIGLNTEEFTDSLNDIMSLVYLIWCPRRDSVC